MKKLLTIFLLLTLCCVCVFGTTVAYAEEVPETAIETVSEETTEVENLETIKEKLNALIAKHNAEIDTAKNFFNKYILPAIISAVIATVTGLIFGVKGRKGKKEYIAKYNEVAIAYNEQSKTLKFLQEEKEQNTAIVTLYNDKVIPLIVDLQTENAELKKDIKDTKIALLSFADGATIAWSELPDAVRAVLACKLKLQETENE